MSSFAYAAPFVFNDPADAELDAYTPTTADLVHEKLLVGYFEQWAVFGPNVHIQDVSLDRMTHLVYESAGLGAEGNIVIGQPVADMYFQYPEDDMSKQEFAGSFHAMVKAKRQHPELKTLLAVGDWDRSQYYSRIAADENLRKNAIESIVDTMKRYEFDGIDIYWLFPVKANDVPDSFREEDPQNYLAFIKRLRYAFDQLEEDEGKHYLLTATLDYIATENIGVVAESAKYLDFIHLDTSQFSGSWTTTTEHIAPLYTNPNSSTNGSIAERIEALESHNIDLKKVVINIAPFGQGWEELENAKSGNGNGLFIPRKSVSWGSWETDANQRLGIYSRPDLRRFQSIDGYQEYWDDISKASYLFAPNRFNGHFISFESKQSIDAKIAFIEEKKLAGIGLRSLHNDDYRQRSILSILYAHFHPMHAVWLDSRDFIVRYKNIILITSAIIFVILLFFITLQYRQNKQTSEELVESKRFENLTFHLQLMEWALIQLRQLWVVNQSQAVKLQVNQLPEINHQVASLLKPVSYLLHETKLGVSPRHSQMRAVNMLEISHHLRTMLIAHPSVTEKNFRLEMEQHLTVYTDPSYLVQLILSIFYLILENTSGDDCITIEVKEANVGPTQFSIFNHSSAFNGFRNQDFLRLKEIYRTAHQMGLELQHQAENKATFVFFVNKVQNAQPDALGHWLERKEIELNEAAQPESAIVEDEETEYLDFLEKFTREESTSDMSKLIERACRYFSVSVHKSLKFSIYQGEQLVLMIDEIDAKDEDLHKTDYEAGELHFEIESLQPLTPKDVRYFSVLVNQIQLVRQTLKEMVKEPVLLSELYELAKNKDRIYYVQADQGYTTVFFSGRKKTEVLSSRLRTIKQYFDDDALLQIHRSYLINPKKVEKVIKRTKYKYEIEMLEKHLPISRTYLPILRAQFPHWF